jgi:hypothetical protein
LPQPHETEKPRRRSKRKNEIHNTTSIIKERKKKLEEKEDFSKLTKHLGDKNM